MRQIKFRAKTVNESEWVYGMTISHGTVDRKRKCLFFEVAENKWKGVIPETLGQFTGLTDRNGKEIYEGDILSFPNDDSADREVIIFEDGCFQVDDKWFKTALCRIDTHERIIIGNIHDNPEMINQPTEV